MEKNELQRLLAGILLFLWIMGMALVMFGVMNPVEEGGAQDSMIVGGVCTVMCLVPAIILLSMVFRSEKQVKGSQDLASLLRIYRRIKLDELARKMGKSEIEVEKDIVDAIQTGMVQGYIDRTTNEFFTKESLNQQMEVRDMATLKCSACNGPLPASYSRGQTFQCPHCGVSAQVVDKLPPPPPLVPCYPKAPPARYRKK